MSKVISDKYINGEINILFLNNEKVDFLIGPYIHKPTTVTTAHYRITISHCVTDNLGNLSSSLGFSIGQHSAPFTRMNE